LLRCNSEEIEQISFVQHYKRKAVEVKATIQPFATEEEARSQRARQLIRIEGSNRSYKRGAYRGNKNDKNNLQGNIAELGNNVYQYGTQDQGEKVHQNDGGNSRLCRKRVSFSLGFFTPGVAPMFFFPGAPPPFLFSVV
jgi:hypothetical protein